MKKSCVAGYGLFFELLQVSIGVRDCLSSVPSADDWAVVYKYACEQTVLGVCFNGVQEISRRHTEQVANMPVELKMRWLALAASIQRRNEEMDARCLELQKRLAACGLASFVLKGQGVAALYDTDGCVGGKASGGGLSALRQSGDIDIYVPGGFRKVMGVARGIGSIGKCSYVHAEWDVFPDTEVELHYRPSSLRNLLSNRRFQKWASGFDEAGVKACNGVITPPVEFNRVYLLLHCFRHVIGAGIGMRQLMDYYFCLLSKAVEADEQQELKRLLKSFGLYRFAAAVMFVLRQVFLLEDRYMVCPPDRREGEYLLEQTMLGGNFGRYDTRVERGGSFSRNIARKLFMNLRYASHYPSELLWAPASRLYMMWWKRRNV